MKKIIYCLILGAFGLFSEAQGNRVTQGEYFWDTDPGEGNATALTAADGNFDNVLENVLQNTASVPANAGLHTFNIRVKDNTGVWGPAFKNVIHIGNSTTTNYAVLSQAEYFWDTDPGEGNGTALPALDGSFNDIIETILQSDVSLVNPIGLHTFNVRVQDNQGVWGPIFTNVVYNENALSVNPQVSTDSYFFYPNPGTSVIRFNKEIAQVDIFDLNGRFMGTSTNTEISIADLATGTYLLKVTTPDGLIFNRKMIKK